MDVILKEMQKHLDELNKINIEIDQFLKEAEMQDKRRHDRIEQGKSIYEKSDHLPEENRSLNNIDLAEPGSKREDVVQEEAVKRGNLIREAAIGFFVTLGESLNDNLNFAIYAIAGGVHFSGTVSKESVPKDVLNQLGVKK